MKKTLITATLALALTTPAMAAQNKEHKEPKPMPQQTAIGLGSGAVFGAVVGGPIGAFIGAFAGALIGEKEAAEEVIEAQQLALVDYDQTRQSLAKSQAQGERLSERLSLLEAHNLRLEQARIDNLMAMTVQFRSGSSNIESVFASQLDQLAELLKQQPGIALDLNGFADQRGDDAANLALSKARADAVQAYLIKRGVEHTRLYSTGFGEQGRLAKADDFEGDFFDRRVTLKPRSAQMNSGVAQR